MINLKEDKRNRNVFLKIESMSDDIFYSVEQAYWEIGKKLEAHLKMGLKRGTRSGRGYKYNGRLLKASAPGEFPQRRTGVLRNSTRFEVFSYKSMWFGITDKAPYAEYLEAGTRKIKPRLLVGETVKSTRREQINIIEKRLDRAVKN